MKNVAIYPGTFDPITNGHVDVIKKALKFVDKLLDAGVADLKIVENFAFSESDEFDVEQSEDTLSILSRYLDESETDIDKIEAKNIIRNIYQEACEVV